MQQIATFGDTVGPFFVSFLNLTKPAN